MRILVTRPQPQADQWVQRLRARGIPADALPLLAIVPAADTDAVRTAGAALAQYACAMFVSPNAIERFFAEQTGGFAWPARVLAACTGPGSAAALRQHGVPEALIAQPRADSAQFDSEALWTHALASRDWTNRRVLIVRGVSGRDWLAETWRAAGAVPEFVHSYASAEPRLSEAEQALMRDALARPGDTVWLFSSSQAIATLQRLAPAGVDWAEVRALATHPRIAERARAAGLGQVLETRPDEESVVAAIQALTIATIKSVRS